MTTARRRGPRGDLNVETFVVAAEKLVAEGGPGALTLRALAGAAGATPTAVYTYVTDMDAVANLVADRFLGRIDLGPLAGLPDDPAGTLEDVVRAIWRLFAANPGPTALLARGPVIGPHAMALHEALLGFLVRCGLGLDEAADAVYALTAYLHGHVLLESTAAHSPATREARRSLNAEDYPLAAQIRESSESLPGLSAWVRGLHLDRR